jgi:hypothetical protein
VHSYGSERPQTPAASSPLGSQISRAGPISGDSDAAKSRLSAPSPFAALTLDPISKPTENAATKKPSPVVLIAGRTGAGFTDAPGSALALADASAVPPPAPQNLDPQSRMQPAPRRQSQASNTSLKPGGTAAQEKVRNLILEQARQQANNSSLRVAIFAVEDGIRVVARVGVIHEAEKIRLRESIAALLAERGLTDAGVIIQASSQPGNRSRQG